MIYTYWAPLKLERAVKEKKGPENPKMLSLFSVLLVETYLSTLANSTLIILF
jgi:hypothetical protein